MFSYILPPVYQLNKFFFKYPVKSNYYLYTKYYVTNRFNSFTKFKYDHELENAINKQIVCEKQAAEAYLELAVKFLHPGVSYIGIGAFFMKMYEEELGHMKQFINYQLIRGGSPIMTNNSKSDSVTPLNAFNQSLDMEKKITEKLQELVKTAEKSSDYQCADMVTSKFLAEQNFSINELAQYVTNLERLENDKHALYQFDLELSKHFKYTLK